MRCSLVFVHGSLVVLRFVRCFVAVFLSFPRAVGDAPGVEIDLSGSGLVVSGGSCGESNLAPHTGAVSCLFGSQS